MGRVGLYAFLIIAALFFLTPLYVMIVTSLKTMPEIRAGDILSIPTAPTIEPWIKAWSSACTGLRCDGIRVGFFNSVKILIPSVIVSILVGSLTGYALSFWRAPGAGILFGAMMIVAFIPYQTFIYPLVRNLLDGGRRNVADDDRDHSYDFRPADHDLAVQKLFRVAAAGAVQGRARGRRWLFPDIRLDHDADGDADDHRRRDLAGHRNLERLHPRPHFRRAREFANDGELNNIVNSVQGERAYNVDMAATMLTALVPLIVYFGSGRWFVRGIASGAVKG